MKVPSHLKDQKHEENFKRLQKMNIKLAKKFAQLPAVSVEVAIPGIERHFNACRIHNIQPDFEAINDVLNLASQGRSSYC